MKNRRGFFSRGRNRYVRVIKCKSLLSINRFLHTPFPASEYYRVLKVREELLHGVLSANLVGFHVYDYIRHFIQAVVQLTSLETTPQGVDATPIGGCVVRCATMPIGIDPKEFVNKLQTDEVNEWVRVGGFVDG